MGREAVADRRVDRPSWARRQARRAVRHWAWLTVAAVVGAGLVAMSLDYWRKGLFVIGLAAYLAAAYRLVLPRRPGFLFVVRTRPVDVLVLLTLGTVIVVLAIVIPPNPATV